MLTGIGHVMCHSEGQQYEWVHAGWSDSRSNHIVLADARQPKAALLRTQPHGAPVCVLRHTDGAQCGEGGGAGAGGGIVASGSDDGSVLLLGGGRKPAAPMPMAAPDTGGLVFKDLVQKCRELVG